MSTAQFTVRIAYNRPSNLNHPQEGHIYIKRPTQPVIKRVFCTNLLISTQLSHFRLPIRCLPALGKSSIAFLPCNDYLLSADPSDTIFGSKE